MNATRLWYFYPLSTIYISAMHLPQAFDVDERSPCLNNVILEHRQLFRLLLLSGEIYFIRSGVLAFIRR